MRGYQGTLTRAFEQFVAILAVVVPLLGQGYVQGVTGQTITNGNPCSPLSNSSSGNPCTIGLANPITPVPPILDILDLQATWNTTSTVFGIDQNITNMQSSSSSLFLNLQSTNATTSAKTSVMSVDPNGTTSAAQFTSGSPVSLAPSPAFTYVSGASGCPMGTPTVIFTDGGGTGAQATVTVATSGGSPNSTPVSIMTQGHGYTSPPQHGFVTGCTSPNATFSGGSLVGYVLDASTGAFPGAPPIGGLLRMYPDASTLLFTGVDNSGDISIMVPRGTAGVTGLPLLSQGPSTNPTYGPVNLASAVTGTLPNGNLPSQSQWTSNDEMASTPPVAVAVQNAYINDVTSQLTYTLPTTCNLGDRFRVIGGKSGTGGWKIGQNANQLIHFGSVSSTGGINGFISSTQQFDSVELVNVAPCTDWVVVSAIGNITVN